MEVKLARKLGFCFGVRRAIKIAEKNKNSSTLGPLIHNYQEINRLKNDFNVGLKESYDDIQDGSTLIIRTHGIPKQVLESIATKPVRIVDATCPFVTKPQQIVEKMSEDGYEIVIFGDEDHPEIKGVKSYAKNGALVVASLEELQPQQIVEKMSEDGYEIVIFGDEDHPEIKGVKSYAKNGALVVASLEELLQHSFKRKKVALISQTTKQIEKFSQIACYLIENCAEVRVFNTICNATFKKVALISQTTKQIEKFSQIACYLIENCAEVRVFNTICNATFDNQRACKELSKEVDIMIVVGGKTSSNTKQLLSIALEHCKDSYLVEDTSEIDSSWFVGKQMCGITAGASTPDWIVQEVVAYVQNI